MILKLFLFWRIGLFLVTALGSILFPVAYNGGLGAPTLTKPFDYWLSWAQWDGGHLYNIAKRGYILDSDFAFFPLYPTAVKLLSELTPLNLLTAGLLISNLAFLTFLIIFYRYLKKRYSPKVALSSTITFLCFPTTFFAVAFYSEGPFLLLVVLAFYFLHEKRLLAASVFVSLAAVTRLVGITLIISILYNYLSSISFRLKNISSKILIPAVSMFGIAAYSIYLASFTNDPFKFASSQAIWQRQASDPVSTIVSYFWTIVTNPATPFDQYLDLATTLIMLVILALGIKKIPSSLWIFSILVILIPASSGTLTSMPRYVLSSLGAFIIIGIFLKDHPKLQFPLWSASLFLQAILAVRFINGYWVA